MSVHVKAIEIRIVVTSSIDCIAIQSIPRHSSSLIFFFLEVLRIPLERCFSGLFEAKQCGDVIRYFRWRSPSLPKQLPQKCIKGGKTNSQVIVEAFGM